METIVSPAPISTYRAIKHWHVDEKPREKLVSKGASALSTSELLAILLNNGSRKKSAITLAQEVLGLAAHNLSELGRKELHEFKKIKGIGDAKAITIMAAMELARRRQAGYMHKKSQIRGSREAALYFKPLLSDLPYESFHALFLNNASRVLEHRCFSQGGINSTIVDARIVFKEAVTLGASRVILCHNHPSGSLKPSEADILLTRKFVQAGQLLDIQVMDHIIVSVAGYCSLADEGVL
jgi:DNA repair protein RadC